MAEGTSFEVDWVLKGKVSMGRGVVLEDGVVLDAGTHVGSIEIGDGSKVKRLTTIRSYDGGVRIGKKVSIGEGCVLFGHGGIDVGDYSIFGPGVVLPASGHIFTEFDVPIRFQGETAKGIRIGRDVWLGARSVILDGVSIGEGSVVGAGAVVTRDVAPFSIVAGVPGRVIGSRKEA